MQSGWSDRMERLFNRRSDGRAICVAADHGYMSDVTPNVVNLRSIARAVVQGGADGVLLSPGQAVRLAPLFEGPDGAALIVRADWMNMPRLGGSNVTNAVPQRGLFHQPVLGPADALRLGATAITIYLFLGYDDRLEAAGVASCARFASECRRAGLPCIMEPLAVGSRVNGTNIVDLLTLGARMCAELGADTIKIPYTGDVESFARVVRVSQVPVLVLGGARSEDERDALELLAEGLEAGSAGCLMGRNVTKSHDPEKLVRQLCQMAHEGFSVEDALRGRQWDKVRLRVVSSKCTGCNLCVTACVAAHGERRFGSQLARLGIEPIRLGQHRVSYCTLCKKCIDICPESALSWHGSTGAVELHPDRCTACGKCVEICPTHVISKAPTAAQGRRLEPWLPAICDLCGGGPACARICPTEAITLGERSTVK